MSNKIFEEWDPTICIYSKLKLEKKTNEKRKKSQEKNKQNPPPIQQKNAA